ncbi:MAG: chemotaxis protein CheR [Cytophagales bacterium]|nr:chemotaxis protein CheR [Cytophagales bacterium]
MHIATAPMQKKKFINEADFKRLSNFVTSNYGIKLPSQKKTMVEGRLQKRLKIRTMDSFKEYIDLALSDADPQETKEMINAISTNKTDFFRESSHFDFLTNVILQETENTFSNKGLKIWSAASSSGEEIYTLAMVMEEHFRLSNQKRFDYSILGTDISANVLRKAKAGVYQSSRLDQLPIDLKQRYFLQGKDAKQDEVRVKPFLRNKTKFGRLNLMNSTYHMDESFDMIFCRNVLIYFERQTQINVVRKLRDRLKIGGYLFLGHSESLFGKTSDLRQIKPTIYTRER